MITEHERRVLWEMEVRLRVEDPRLAARLSTSLPERLSLEVRALQTPLSLLAALGGMVLIVMFFATSPAVALAGVGLLGSAAGANANRLAAAASRAGRRASHWLAGSDPGDRGNRPAGAR
jgi:hypothetical protein